MISDIVWAARSKYTLTGLYIVLSNLCGEREERRNKNKIVNKVFFFELDFCPLQPVFQIHLDWWIPSGSTKSEFLGMEQGICIFNKHSV